MAMDSMLIDRATIERASPQVSPAGDVTLEWLELYTDVPCMVQEKQVRESVSPVGEIVYTKAIAYFADTVDLKPGVGDEQCDHIRVNNKTWRVCGVTKSPGPRGAFVVADLEE